MNQNDEDEFWSKIGEKIRPRLTEAHWADQRRRIVSRLTPEKSGRLRYWTAAAALAGLAGIWLMRPDMRTVTRTSEAPPQISIWDARITRVQGPVKVYPIGAGGVAAEEGMPIDAGDTILASSGGSVEVALSSEAVVDLSSGATITFVQLDSMKTFLKLDSGILIAKLDWKHIPGRTLEVLTPTAVATLRGTEFGVLVESGGDTSIGVFDEGKVSVRTRGASTIEETLLAPHQEVHIPAGSPIETDMKENRRYFRVNELSDFKPYQHQVAGMREESKDLSRTWKEMGRPEREQVRSRITETHRGRMQAPPLDQMPGAHEQSSHSERVPQRPEHPGREPGATQSDPRHRQRRNRQQNRSPDESYPSGGRPEGGGPPGGGPPGGGPPGGGPPGGGPPGGGPPGGGPPGGGPPGGGPPGGGPPGGGPPGGGPPQGGRPPRR